MERARATWTDERLDDLAHRMDDGFRRMDEEFRTLRTELGARIDAHGAELGARMDAQGAELGARIDAQGARIDALQRTMIQVGAGIIATMIATLLGVIMAQL